MTAPFAAAGATQAPGSLAPGSEVDGRYRVERVLGEGGMGVVLAARHLQLGERVALKLLRVSPERVKAQDVARFRREARAAVRIKGQHAARAMDSGTHEGLPYLVFEYVEGESLSAVLKARGPLAPAVAVGYLLQACEALAEAHALGIVHRDLKPANLMLSSGPDGSPLIKVLDFGIARLTDEEVGTLTGSSATLGSPRYMSPEQIRHAHEVDARADLWSLGVTLYEMLTARVPFDATTAPALFAAILMDPPVPPRRHAPGLPPGLEPVLLRCLEKDPDLRFQDVACLADELAPFVPDGPLLASRIRRILGRKPSPELPASSPAVTLGETAPPSPLFNTLALPTSVTAGGPRSVSSVAPPRRGSPGLLLAGLVGLAGLLGWGASVLSRPAPPAPSTSGARLVASSAQALPSAPLTLASALPAPLAASPGTSLPTTSPGTSPPPVVPGASSLPGVGVKQHHRGAPPGAASVVAATPAAVPPSAAVAAPAKAPTPAPGGTDGLDFGPRK